MPTPKNELKTYLARTRLVVLPEDYYLVRLPLESKPIPSEWYRPATTRFAVFVREPKEITLIVARRKWIRMKNLFDDFQISGPMKVISFDLALPLNVFGYMAALSKVLAEARISIIPVSTFHRDHILVKKSDLPKAVKSLRAYLSRCRKNGAALKARPPRAKSPIG